MSLKKPQTLFKIQMKSTDSCFFEAGGKSEQIIFAS